MKYDKLISKLVYSCNPKDFSEIEEYTSVANLAVLKAIKQYDKNYGTKEITFVWWVIKRALWNFIKKNKRYDPLPENYVSKHKTENIQDYIPNSLTFKERKIIDLKNQGFSFDDIANMFNCSKTWVNCIYHRAINKIKESNV